MFSQKTHLRPARLLFCSLSIFYRFVILTKYKWRTAIECYENSIRLARGWMRPWRKRHEHFLVRYVRGFLFARLSLTFRSRCSANLCQSPRHNSQVRCPLIVHCARPVALTTIFHVGFSCSSFATRPSRYGARFFYWLNIYFLRQTIRWIQLRLYFPVSSSRAKMRNNAVVRSCTKR